MKKRFIAFVTVIVLLLTFLSTAAAAKKPPLPPRIVDSYAVETEEADGWAADLMAGQSTKVGEVYIDAIGENKYLVTYKITQEDWYLSEVHFEAISQGDEVYVFSKGGLIPGQFTVNRSFAKPVIDVGTGVISGGTQVFSFIYISGAPVISFAAHAVVCKAEKHMTSEVIQTGTDTVTGSVISDAGMDIPEMETNSVEVREPFDYADESVDEDYSVWDEAFSAVPAFNDKIIANGAQIIWKSLYAGGDTQVNNDKTLYGDVFKVNVPVDVPSDASNISGTLYIVADNAYIAKLDGSIIGSAGFNAANYAAKTPETEIASDTDALLLEIFPSLRANDGQNAYFTSDVVDSSAWTTMITMAEPVPLAIGANLIEIAAMNEYMGAADGQEDGTWYNNPAGVIFFIEYSWDIPVFETKYTYSLSFSCCETAWGAGEDVPGGNWSKIITDVPPYDPPPVIVEYPEDGTAYIGYEDAIAGDFDYNDAGMNMALQETYEDGVLKSISMTFEFLVKKAGYTHQIHIARPLEGDYEYSVSRTGGTYGGEAPEAADVSASGDFDIILFDTADTTPRTVTIVIDMADGNELNHLTDYSLPSRFDLDELFSLYDPWLDITSESSPDIHIQDLQPATGALPTQGYDVPYIIVVPVTNWPAPDEGVTITNVYPDFDDYYSTQSSSYEDWFD